MATVARSRALWGPYEGCPDNPILTNVHDTSKAVLCSGHADLLQDHRGNWWMVHLAIRTARRTMSHLGRETETGIFLILDKTAEDMRQTACMLPVPSGLIQLRILADKERYYFSFSMDGNNYHEAAQASTRFLSCEVAGRCFTGTVMGTYNACKRKTSAVMEVWKFCWGKSN